MSKMPALPPSAPQMGTPVWRFLARLLVACTPWRIDGALPDVPKLVMIGAPHSSNWDGVFGLCSAVAIGFKPAWMGKQSLFKGLLGRICTALGGVAIDRNNPTGVVGQMITEFQTHERLWLTLAPEGTRKVVPKWRSGFYHVAVAAGVPILPLAFDFPGRRFVILDLFHPTGDYAADMAELEKLYAPWRGRFGKRALPNGPPPA
jgi:1-acyl-sn-glycerol-3-phosphate acyltransferase